METPLTSNVALVVAIADFCTSFDRIDDPTHTTLKPLLNGYPVLVLDLRAGNALEASRSVSTQAYEKILH